MVDLGNLELACGREGFKAKTTALERFNKWSTTCGARRAVLHAVDITRGIKNVPLGEEISPHVVCSALQSCKFLYTRVSE